MKNIYTDQELGYVANLDSYAQLANGAVWIQQGGTVVLVTVVSEEAQEFPGFLPLSVDYREHFASIGKIPGGYFKREGKPTDKEVLSGRIIDRTIRPLFPENYFDKVAVVATIYSIDMNHLPHTLAVVGTSLALCASNIPFLEPVGCCQIVRLNNQWLVHPTHEQLLKSNARLTVSGTYSGINMVEGASTGVTEEELLDGMFIAHEEIKKQIKWQKEILAQRKVEKKVSDKFNTDLWEQYAREFLTQDSVLPVFVADKNLRATEYKKLLNKFLDHIKEAMEAEDTSSAFIENTAFSKVFQEIVGEIIFSRKKRIDGRDFASIRNISSDIALLPTNHGSAIFNRGTTQVLASVTLGSGEDELKIESVIEEQETPFMLHYNFLPFSVGEARSLRGPGRREVGHGNLAANAIRAILPEKEIFPYTIRVVADVIACDGSSSQGTICSAMLALMDAGVPVTGMVGGVAMGMLQNLKGEFVILSDINGFEDHFGLMDLKVAGTETHVTALQMDIKYQGGLEKSFFEAAFKQARDGRLQILKAMKNTITSPREQLSSLVPQFVTFKVNKDKIGAIIGTGGKVIREITEKTNTSINIEDDGLVKIFGTPNSGLEKAVSWVKLIAGEIIVGSSFEGIVKKIAEFGYFVELVPGLDGLVHVSSIAKNKLEEYKRKIREGDKVQVVVLDYDSLTGRIRLKIVE